MPTPHGQGRPARVYLDYNATAPVRPEVRQAVEPILFGEVTEGRFGNASSVHWAGQAARRALESARARVANVLSRKPSEVIFTSGGSEADNLALRGVLLHAKVQRPRLLISAVEHPAVRGPALALQQSGVDVVEIPVDANGQLRLDALEAELQTPTTLVSVMAVNNETGVCLPIDEVIRLARAAGAQVHVDAVQAAGRCPLPSDADLITLSGHKLGGLPGAGVLAFRDDQPLAAQQLGGPQERGHRAGTESVASAVALATALDLAETHRPREVVRLRRLRDQLEAGLALLPDVRVVGAEAHRVTAVSTVLFEHVDGETVLQGLDLEGIATSSGSACSSGSLEPSHVLLAMGIDGHTAMAAVRFSLGWASEQADIERALAVLPNVVERAR
ncbi:MAG: cysteine desulfurase family protein, partial [Myxococcota bacterium]